MSDADYFFVLNRELGRSGPAEPCLIIDVDRLDDNIQALIGGLPQGRTLRVVDKSLPSPTLIRHVLQRARTHRLMSFHLPFLAQLVQDLAELDVLIGKPLPVRSVQAFFAGLHRDSWQRLALGIAWLVDSRERLAQYLELAERLGLRLRVAIEIDVGLCRGGLSEPEQLAPLMDRMHEYGERLRFAGLVGYDAHAARAGRLLSEDAAIQRAQHRYRAFVEYLTIRYQPLLLDPPIWNGAGSPTALLQGQDTPLNDIAVGSAFLKPLDFDLPSLSELEPAVHIAAPVLKRLRGVRLPHLGRIGGWLSGGRGMDACFVYGGHWLARPVHPRGTRANAMYGVSSNQQMFMIPSDTVLSVDDYMFLRPTQSEAVLLEFGDLIIVREGRVVDRWPVFRR